MKNDPWVAANSPLEPEKLHAMGVITFHWNMCEFYLRSLFAFTSGRSFQSVWEETSGNRARDLYKKIRGAVANGHDNNTTKDAVLYAIDLYDRNRENRNQIMHFIPEGGESSTLHNLRNRNFLAIFDQHPIPSDIKDLRRVAEEIRACRSYLVALLNALSRPPLDAINGITGPLPDKPSMPSHLWHPSILQSGNIEF